MSAIEPCLILTVGPVTVHVNVHGRSGLEREAAARAVRRMSEQMAMLLGDVVEMALGEGPGRTQSAAIPPVAGLGVAQSEAVPPVADSSAAAAESVPQGPARHGRVAAERKAAVRQAGIDLKQAWGTGGSAPTPPRPQPPLRARVWVAVGGSAATSGQAAPRRPPRRYLRAMWWVFHLWKSMPSCRGWKCKWPTGGGDLVGVEIGKQGEE